MSGFDRVIVGQRTLPPRLAIHGDGGIGKTTFGAGAPSPIFVPTEEGADEVGCARFPLAETFADFKANLRDVIKEGAERGHGAVVIDSADWLERLIHADVAKEAGVKSVETIGYGRGYIAAADKMRDVLAQLDECRSQGLAIVVICHSQIVRFDSPETEPYDRWTLKMHKSATALLVEWADVVGFATMETRVKTTEVGFNKEIRRGATTGKRVLRLDNAPAYVAKNRYGLPATIPLEWQAFVDAMEKRAVKGSIAAVKSNNAEKKTETAAVTEKGV